MGAKPRAVPMRFELAPNPVRATVRVAQTSGGPLYLDAPTPFVSGLESSARLAVRGRLAATPFASALVPVGGRHRLFINRYLAAKSGVFSGARVTLEIERVLDPALARAMKKTESTK